MYKALRMDMNFNYTADAVILRLSTLFLGTLTLNFQQMCSNFQRLLMHKNFQYWYYNFQADFFTACPKICRNSQKYFHQGNFNRILTVQLRNT